MCVQYVHRPSILKFLNNLCVSRWQWILPITTLQCTIDTGKRIETKTTRKKNIGEKWKPKSMNCVDVCSMNTILRGASQWYSHTELCYRRYVVRLYCVWMFCFSFCFLLLCLPRPVDPVNFHSWESERVEYMKCATNTMTIWISISMRMFNRSLFNRNFFLFCSIWHLKLFGSDECDGDGVGNEANRKKIIKKKRKIQIC